MERKVLDCDRCGTEDSVRAEGRIQVAVGSDSSGSGSSETEYRRVDLCPSCLAAELTGIVKKLSLEDGKAFWSRVMNFASSRPNPNVRRSAQLQ